MPNISQAVLYFMIYFKSQFLINFETIFYVYISDLLEKYVLSKIFSFNLLAAYNRYDKKLWKKKRNGKKKLKNSFYFK